MSSKYGVRGILNKAGQEQDVIYVVWHTADPAERWFVTIKETHERAILKELVDRRPHEGNIGFTQDAWKYEIVTEKTWMRMQAGGLPIPPKVI